MKQKLKSQTTSAMATWCASCASRRRLPGKALIDPNAFWTKVEASYLSDPRMFLRQHECPILDYIVRHDHLPIDPPPAVTTTILPPLTNCPPPVIGSPPTNTGTHDPGDPPQVIGVPEPSSIVLAGLAALIVVGRSFTRALSPAARHFGIMVKR